MNSLKIDFSRIFIFTFLFLLLSNIDVFAEAFDEPDSANLGVNVSTHSGEYKYELLKNQIIEQEGAGRLTTVMAEIKASIPNFNERYPDGFKAGEIWVDYVEVDQRDFYENLPDLSGGKTLFGNTLTYDIFSFFSRVKQPNLLYSFIYFS